MPPLNEYDEMLTEQGAPTNAAPKNEYDEILAGDKTQQRDVLNQSMAVATQTDPDKRGKSIQLSQQMNLPPEFVEKNYDELSKNFKVQSLPYERIISEAPGTAKFMENPNNAAIAHDDIDNLTHIERGIKIVTGKRKRETLFTMPSELINAGKAGLSSLGSTAAQMGYAYGVTTGDEALQTIADYNLAARKAQAEAPDYAKEFSQMFQKEGGDVNKAWSQFIATYDDLKKGHIVQALVDFNVGRTKLAMQTLDLIYQAAVRPRGLLYSSVEQIFNAAPGLVGTYMGAAAPVPPVAKPFTMFAGGFMGATFSEIGSQINEQFEKRGFDVTKVEDLKKAYSDPKLMAEIRGMAERKGITTAAVDALFNTFAGAAAAKLGKEASVLSKAGAHAKDTGIQMLGETLSEAAGQFAREGGDLSKVDIAESVQEGILAMGHGAVEQAAALSTFRKNLHPDPLVAAEQLATSADQAVEVQEAAQALAEVAGVMAESKVEQRVPGKIAELIDLAGGKGANIFYQTDDWDSMWSAKGISPVKADEAIMGDAGKSYHEAKATSGMLAFPLSSFMQQAAAQENFQEILDLARLKSPGNPTLKEAQQIIDQLPATLKELSQEAVAQAAEEAANQAYPDAQKSADQVTENVGDQLREQGMDASQAKLVGKMMKRIGEEFQADPMQMFKKYPLSVKEDDGSWQKKTEKIYHQSGKALAPGVTVSPLGFFSPLEKSVVEMDFKTTPAKDLLGRLKNAPGIKAEELEFTGFQEFLEAVAANAGTQPAPSKWAIVEKGASDTAASAGLFPSEEAAKNWIIDNGLEDSSETRQVPDTTNRTGKVTKEAALNFLRQGGLQVEQKVLGEDFVDDEDAAAVRASELEWSEIEWDEPDDYMVWEDAQENFSGNDFYELTSEIEKKKTTKLGDDDWFYVDQYREALDELKEEYSEEFVTDVLDGEGKLKKQFKQELKEKLWSKLEDNYYERALEYAKDPESGRLNGTVTESNTEWTLTGNDEVGWYSSEAGKDMGGDLEEAKVQLVQYMIAEGKISGKLADINSPDDIVWKEPIAAGEGLDERIALLADKLLAEERPRFEKEAKEYYHWNYDENDSAEEQAKSLVNDSQKMAEEEATRMLGDASKPENIVATTISNPIIKGQIKGSEANGWSFQITSPRAQAEKFQLNSGTLEFAKNEALTILQKKELVSDPSKKEALPAVDEKQDVNAPTGESKWDRYTEPGGTNYREFLLRLPSVKGTFKHGAHFSESNILAHVRVKDRVDENGKKILFIEELQSDWHQQGRERGYQGEDETKPLKELPEGYTIRKEDDEDDPEHGKNLFRVYDENGKLFTDAYFNTEEEAAKDTLEIINENRAEAGRKSVPDAPFKNTDAWAALAMKRMLRVAQEQGYDGIAWTAAETHVDRWGTESVGWVKRDGGKFEIVGPMGRAVEGAPKTFDSREEAEKVFSQSDMSREGSGYEIREIPPHFLVGSTEQLGGNAGGVNIEEAAREQGKLLEKNGERVTNEEELKNVLRSTLGRQRGDRSLESLAQSIWKQMQEKPLGKREPRAEGMQFFYDNLLPKKVLPAILKKLDKNAKVSVEKMVFDGTEKDVWKVNLTDEAKKKMEDGFTLFQEGQNGPRGYINLLDHEAVARFTKAKDPSSFFHEFGHYQLEFLSRLVREGNAPESVQGWWAEISKFLELEEGKPITEAQQEKWARAHEKYIMEGKAPSSAMREMFQKFKLWMISVYRELRNLNVELTPEIRKVFDSLYASDEEIKHAHQSMGYEPLYSSAEEAGMTEEQHLRYQKAQADAIAAAEEQLTARLMKDYKREQTTMWEGEKNVLKSQIELQVNESPAYKALYTLQKGTLPDGTPTAPMKLDRVSLNNKKAYSADLVSKLPKGITTKEGGISPDQAADLLGFPSGNDLLKSLVEANMVKKDDLVDRLAEEAMKQKHGEILKSDQLPDEAIKALHNDKRAELLRMELEHMMENNPSAVKDVAKKLIRRVPPKKEVREQARNIIGTNAVGSTKPYIYQRAEIKAAKQAADAFGKGDFDSAFEFKLKELLNHELYRASVDALEQIQESAEKFKKIITGKDSDLAKTRNMDLVNAARAVLAKFGIGQTEKSPEDYLKYLGQYDPDTHQTMVALVEAATERTGDVQAITYDDFVAMKTAVDALWQLSRDHKQVELDGRKMSKDLAVDELKTTLSEWSKTGEKQGFTSSPSESEKNRIQILGTQAAYRRVEFWAKQMGPAFTKILFKPISEASNAYRERQLKERREYAKRLKAIEKSITYENISSKELQHVFNGKAELLHAILHRGNESNFKKLLMGYGWATLNPDGTMDISRWKAFEDRMQREGILTKEDYDFAQSVWDLLDSYKTEAQGAHKKMYGHYFNEVTANEFDTAYGKYRGGYAPAIVDVNQVEDAAIRADKNALEGENNSFMFPTAGRGFTKSRVEEYAAPLALDLRLIPLHIDKVLRFIHIEPTVKEVGRIVMDKNFRAALAEVNPTWGSEMLVPWLQRAAQQMVGVRPQGVWAKASARFWRGIRKRSSMTLLAGNFINAAQQVLGVVVAGTNVSKRRLLSALFRYMKNPKQVAATMREIAPEMATRLDGEVFEMQKTIDDLLLNPTKYEQAKDFMERHGSFFSSFAQGMVDTVVFTAAYDQAVARGGNAEEAKYEALSQVRTSQGSRNPEDISRFEAGSEFNKAFGGMFYNYFNTIANLMGTEFAIAVHDMGLKKGAGRMAYVHMMAMMIPAAMGTLLVRGLGGTGLDEDDDGEYADDIMDILFMSQLRYAAAMVPGIGPAALSTLTVFNDKWYDDKISTSPVVSTVENAVHAPFSVYKAITNPGNSKRAVQDVFTAIGLVTGLPTSVVSRPLGYAVDVAEGKVRPSGPIDFTRGMLTGKGKRK